MNTIYKDCEIVMLPTNEKANIFIDSEGLLLFTPSYIKSNIHWKDVTHQHLYILASNEEIKEGDCWIYLNPKEWNLPQEGIVKNSLPKEWFNKLWDRNNYKKVIATTDLLLGKYIDGDNPLYGEFIGVALPQIPQEFINLYIEEYNKGNVLSKVQVEYEDKLQYEGMIHPGSGGNDRFKEQIKINLDNTTSIKPIKESWNREELQPILLKICQDLDDSIKKGTDNEFNVENWMNQNL